MGAKRNKLAAVARKTAIKFVDLGAQKIGKHLLGMLPEQIMRRYQMVPVALDESSLHLAMVDPENAEAIELVKKTVGKKVIPLLTTQADLARALDTSESGGAAIRALAEEAEDIIEAVPEAKEPKESAEAAAMEHAPAAKLISQLIKRAVRESASDIHLEPGEEMSQIRFRIDGVLADCPSPTPFIKACLADVLWPASGSTNTAFKTAASGRLLIMAKSMIS